MNYLQNFALRCLFSTCFLSLSLVTLICAGLCAANDEPDTYEALRSQFLDPEWWELFAHTHKECQRLGMAHRKREGANG